MRKLDQKVALVTGASSGIGAAIAKQFAAEGAKVIVNFRVDQIKASEVVETIKANGGEAVAVRADITNESEIKKLFDIVAQNYGRLDILVNNAGIFEFRSVRDITLEHITTHLSLNLTALILCCKQAVIAFDGSGGNIINISSCDGVYPPANGSVYSATKAAVDAVTQSLSKELGVENIRINSINPGLVKTDGAERQGFLTESIIEETIKITPLGRIADPDEVAKVALFLASSDSSWITGEQIVVSGGQR